MSVAASHIPMFRSFLSAVGNAFESVVFTKQARLFEEGRPADSLWLLKSGCVKLVKGLKNPPLVTLEIIFPGELFGRTALGRGPAYTASAVALVPGEALRIPAAVAWKMARSSPEVAADAALILNRRSERLERIRMLFRKPVRERVMELLEDLSARSGGDIPLSCQDVADLAGARVETIIRLFSILRREGWIEKQRGLIRLYERPIVKTET